jgi:hypothetical protein
MDDDAARNRRILWALVASAAVLRFWGGWFGLPYAYARPDEAESLHYAMGIVAGDPNPHFFHWPSLHFYALALLFRLDALIQQVPPDAVAYAHRLLLARIWVAVLGVLTVPVAYRLGRRVGSEGVGLAAAALLAVAPLHVRDSHFAMTDVAMTLLVTAALWWLIEGAVSLETAAASDGHVGPGVKWLSAAGVTAGLATGTKYSAAAILMPAALAHVWLAVKARRRSATWLLVPGLVFLAAWAAGFLISTPYAVLDSPKFLEDLRFDFTHLAAGHGVRVGVGFVRHLVFSLPLGLGVVVCMAAAAGVWVAARRGGLAHWLLLAFVAAVYVSIGRGYTVFARYALPLVPVGCVLAAVAVHAGWRVRALPRWALPAMVCLIAVPSLVNDVWMNVLLCRADTRAIAERWLTARLPPDATVYQSGSEYVALAIRSPRAHRWYYDAPSGGFVGGTPDMVPQWLVLSRSPVENYVPIPPGIAALAAARYVPVREFRATVGEGTPANYDLQDAFFLPLAGFRGVLRPGPTITVYLRADLAGRTPLRGSDADEPAQ